MKMGLKCLTKTKAYQKLSEAFEKTPLLTPQDIEAPTIPPNTASILKADLIIRENISGTFVILIKISKIATIT